MDWQQIMEQTLEINELQQEVLVKLLNPTIKEIVARQQKYLNDKLLDLKTLNNAILEHKITITPYQVIILSKINELSLNTDPQSIYINMPESEKEAEKYVVELKKKYELVNNCFDLVMNMESLTEIEYEPKLGFENSEYAKLVQKDNELFQKIKDYLLSLNIEAYENILIKEYKQYMNTLTIDKKKDLYIETFTLSYNRNSFEYFNMESLIMKIGNNNNYNLQQIFSLGRQYNTYINSLSLVKKIIMHEMSLQEIYDEFKIIYETDFFKQKIDKK